MFGMAICPERMSMRLMKLFAYGSALIALAGSEALAGGFDESVLRGSTGISYDARPPALPRVQPPMESTRAEFPSPR